MSVRILTLPIRIWWLLIRRKKFTDKAKASYILVAQKSWN